ncbi:indole-3-glycerol-phosphate synthase [Geothrix fermentans]|jgi:indole-3-glycerol phosphate synthase|uniref:indole-3-glycerol-phosphate synthase n=1 Tax=Geothrix fermentans TaxID=44676 RepID=UPI000428F75E|nr:indole-3-glycerol-phosphate synthase [Geothrix fermentans]
MLKKVAIFKALDVEIKKQRGPVAVKDAYKGHHSLKEELSQPGITILGEVAGGDPGRGQVRDSYKASTHAKSLAENGARALSIATDKFLYHGEDKHLSEVRSQVKLPLIRRDFIFEEYQVEESKILGADAIFLMPALLGQDRLETLLKFAMSKGLDVVVEVTSEADLQRAVDAGADIICAVGRNLDTWEPSWDQAVVLVKKIPKSCLKMVEGGIHRLEQIKQMEALGVHGLLIGDALLDDYYPGKRLAQILAGVEPPKKAAKPKGKTGSAADAAHPPTAAAAAKERISTQREAASQPGTKGATGKPSSRTTPSNLAQKGVKEPPMAELTNMVATPAAPAAAKPAAKKPAAKKAAPKKKAAAKKPAAKKAAPKKAAAKKPAAKKAAPKKAAAKKAAPKKAAAKKAAPKKAAAKKVVKKAVKKAAPKKAAAKKAAPKKAAAKKPAAKKAVAKKAAPKKAAAKKPAAKKTVAKKAAPKKAAKK